MQAEDEALETRDIKKRYGELETILRRKTRELDRLNQKGITERIAIPQYCLLCCTLTSHTY